MVSKGEVMQLRHIYRLLDELVVDRSRTVVDTLALAAAIETHWRWFREDSDYADRLDSTHHQLSEPAPVPSPTPLDREGTDGTAELPSPDTPGSPGLGR